MPGLQGKSQSGRVDVPRECPGCLPVHTMEALEPLGSQLPEGLKRFWALNLSSDSFALIRRK
jgi:hypothetical protein